MCVDLHCHSACTPACTSEMRKDIIYMGAQSPARSIWFPVSCHPFRGCSSYRWMRMPHARRGARKLRYTRARVARTHHISDITQHNHAHTHTYIVVSGRQRWHEQTVCIQICIIRIVGYWAIISISAVGFQNSKLRIHSFKCVYYLTKIANCTI